MDSLRASNIEKPLFKITQIKSPINSLSQTNQPTLNDKLLLVTVIPFLRLPFHQSSLKKISLREVVEIRKFVILRRGS